MKRETELKIQKIMQVIEEAAAMLRDIEAAQQEAYDNESESWQESDKGQVMFVNLEVFADATGELEDALEVLLEALVRHRLNGLEY